MQRTNSSLHIHPIATHIFDVPCPLLMIFHVFLACPSVALSSLPLSDPVMDTEGNSYERSAIEQWLEIRGASPLTRTPMEATCLVSNRALKAAIDSDRANLPAMRPDAGPALDPNNIPPVPPAPELLLEVTEVPMEYILPAQAPGSSLVMASIIAPENVHRLPLDAVMCIDTSGSMGMNATAAGVEESGLNMLDIVKHAVKTVIKTLGNEDRLSIVKYSNAAQKVCGLISMTDEGKKKTMELLDTLEDGGMTNLWDGLKTSMEVLMERDQTPVFDIPSAARNAAIYLLTDGTPNVDPPRGYVHAMQRLRDKNNGNYPGTINTFGFGYSLDSNLLLQIAQEGQGAYAFIPDSGFVGTVFVNAVANSLTTLASRCTVSMSTEKADKTLTPVEVDAVAAQVGPDSVNFVGKTMQVGTPFGIVGIVNDTDLPLVLAKLQYTPAGRQDPVTITMVGPEHREVAESDRQEVAAEYFRSITITTIKKCLDLASNSDYAIAGAGIKETVALIKTWLDSTSAVAPKIVPGETKASASARARVIALQEDLEGQLSEACSSDEYFLKWGKHYLRSIMRAHQLKQCNNFKDPGVQVYGNTLFNTVRDNADDIFSTLPPPVPAAPKYGNNYQQYGGGGGFPVASAPDMRDMRYAPVSMASYNDRSRGCFHASALVTMASGARKTANKVIAGDILHDGGRVKCVVKSVFGEGTAQLIRLPPVNENEQGLIITPYHPVLWQGKWQFPIDIGTWVECPCDAVFSFLVESTCVAGKFTACALVDGLPTSMLAHGVTGVPCLSHAFFGTNAIVQALEQCPGYAAGLVVFAQGGYFVRDAVTNDVCGLRTAMAVQC